MNNFKKILPIILLGSVLLLAACGNDQKDEKHSQSADVSQQIELAHSKSFAVIRVQERHSPHLPYPSQSFYDTTRVGLVLSKNGTVATSGIGLDKDTPLEVSIQEQTYSAELIGKDDTSGLAVLQLENAKGLVPVTWTKKAAKLGQSITSIGLTHRGNLKLAQGIVATQPQIKFATDINRSLGTLGAPLVNNQGEVVGLTIAGAHHQAGLVALSAKNVQNYAKQLTKNGKVARGWLGIQIQSVDSRLADTFNLESAQGALVTHILDDAPAADTLKSGDVIIQFAGQDVQNVNALPALVASQQPGSKVNVVVVRDGKNKNLKVKLGQKPTTQTQQTSEKKQQSILGLKLQPLTAADKKDLNLNYGLRIVSVEQGAGADAGLKAGDVILTVDNHKATTTKKLQQYLAKTDTAVALLIWRGGQQVYIAIRPTRTEK